jgi:hypothetical protein
MAVTHIIASQEYATLSLLTRMHASEEKLCDTYFWEMIDPMGSSRFQLRI